VYNYFIYCVSMSPPAGVGPLVVRPDSGDPPTTIIKVLTILGIL